MWIMGSDLMCGRRKVIDVIVWTVMRAGKAQ